MPPASAGGWELGNNYGWALAQIVQLQIGLKPSREKLILIEWAKAPFLFKKLDPDFPFPKLHYSPFIIRCRLLEIWRIVLDSARTDKNFPLFIISEIRRLRERRSKD